MVASLGITFVKYCQRWKTWKTTFTHTWARRGSRPDLLSSLAVQVGALGLVPLIAGPASFGFRFGSIREF